MYNLIILVGRLCSPHVQPSKLMTSDFRADPSIYASVFTLRTVSVVFLFSHFDVETICSELDIYLYICCSKCFVFFSSVTGYISSIDIATPSNTICDFKIQTNSALPENFSNIHFSIFRPQFWDGDIVSYWCLEQRFLKFSRVKSHVHREFIPSKAGLGGSDLEGTCLCNTLEQLQWVEVVLSAWKHRMSAWLLNNKILFVTRDWLKEKSYSEIYRDVSFYGKTQRNKCNHSWREEFGLQCHDWLTKTYFDNLDVVTIVTCMIQNTEILLLTWS